MEPGHAGDTARVIPARGRGARARAYARRDALLEAAAVCDRMADEALEQSRFEYIDTYTVSCFEEAASWLVDARDRLRAMADEPLADDGEVPS